MLATVARKTQVSASPQTTARKSSSKSASVDGFEPSQQRPLQLSYLPQDQGMIAPQLGQVVATDKLANERFQLSVGTGFPKVTADAEGKVVVEDENDPRFDSANCFFIANQTLEVAEKYAGGRIDWSFQDSLGHPMLIKPHAGKDTQNAYYNPQSGSLNFFSYLDEKTGERQRTGMSRDIISHETGHAILDGLRPKYMESLSVGAGGFHESFADMMAMLSALNDEHVIEALRVQTKGDLSKPNIVSGIGEQLGASCFDQGPLREAINKHKYADQAFLPLTDANDPAHGLGSECHSYANLFNGAFYDAFLAFYNQASAQPGVDFAVAVAEARDKVGSLLLRAVEMGPVGDISYREAAMAFLRADLQDNEGANQATLSKIFTDRKIIRPEDAQAVANEEVPELKWSNKLEEADSALEWLNDHRESLGLPADLEFEFEKVRTNEAGERFVQFSSSRDQLLEGPGFGDYEGSQIRAHGGVLLGFDAEGQLFTYNHDEITDREMEDTTAFFQANNAAGQIMRATGEGQSWTKKSMPKLQVESVMVDGHRVLRRGGVI
ncbi:hypothetical protein JST97_25250 [bacterium]|nr:hypothetical protein [bacterium]